jgi:hypothetical protein
VLLVLIGIAVSEAWYSEGVRVQVREYAHYWSPSAAHAKPLSLLSSPLPFPSRLNAQQPFLTSSDTKISGLFLPRF